MLLVVYVCHPFGADPKGNMVKVQAACRGLATLGRLPLAPQLFLPQFIDESTERNLALKLCLELVALSDEVRVYGEPSAGMRLEIAEARRLGISVVNGESGEILANNGDRPGGGTPGRG